MAESYVYPYSRESAHNDGCIDLWRKSHAENIACSRAIEKEITANFDGMHLGKDTAKNVITEFGFNRVNWVLAATVQHLSWDGRFSGANKDWAKQFFMEYIKDEISDYCVRSHPAVLDGFINQTRRAYQELGLFTREHCHEPDTRHNFAGKVLVLRPEMLRDAFKSPDYQLFLASGGFGCRPDASGRKVFGEFLFDSEKCQYNRQDFLGVLEDQHLPDWAREKLQEMQQPEPSQSPELGM